MRCASIDIGTNTLRLLIADVTPDGDGRRSIAPLLYDRRITRLGGGYTEASGISAASAERTISALEFFAAKIRETPGVDTVYATATSVVRRAVNRRALLEAIRTRAGLEVTVITGDEEARLSHAGVISVLDASPGRLLVFDIGGGSTEFIASTTGSAGDGGLSTWSTEMGVVHLSETFLTTDPPGAAEVECVESEVRSVLAALKARMLTDGTDPAGFSAAAGSVLVGTAGTVTTLAALDLGLDQYDREAVNNHLLTREAIEGIYRRMCSLNNSDRARINALEEGRADLIIPGSTITLMTMEAFGFAELVVSDAGLLEGLIIEGGPVESCMVK